MQLFSEENNIIKNAVKHFKLITKHKIEVFKLCVKAGIPLQGLLHDLSKYSITEFWESARYYNGKRSPIGSAQKENGYSKAWLHHKGRNKHHYEYWYEPEAPDPTPVIPYRYAVEMVCDRLAAGIVYNGKDFNNSKPLEFWEYHTNKEYINEKIQKFLGQVFTEVSKKGIDKVITPKNLKKWYREYCEEKI